MNLEIDYRCLNPNSFHLLDCFKNADIRFIFLMGGSSSAKSYSLAQCILIKTLEEGENTRVLRKFGSNIKNSIYEDFRTNANAMGISDYFIFQQNVIKCKENGAKIDFGGLDNPEKIKGIANYKRVVLEELTEFYEPDFKQIKKRLRGKLGQQIVCMFNPITESHWIKEKVFDKEDFTSVSTRIKGVPARLTDIKEKLINKPKFVQNIRTKKIEEHNPDTVVLRSTYLNNFWVVGSPCGKYGFYDRQVVADFERDKVNDYDYYRIYALGDWGSIRTGGEYLHAFNPTNNCSECKFDKSLPVHISVDNNVLPYISITFFQIQGDEIKQFYEICAKDPENTASRAGELAAEYLQSIKYKDVVYLYGDSTTKSRNTIDDEKRSFLDKFQEKIEAVYHVENRVPASNPSVPMSGEFLNYLFIEGRITISHTCKNSINDYSGSKKDANGAVLKKRVKNKETGQTYEEFGHLVDTLRYLSCTALKEEYIRFSNKRKHNEVKDNDMKYYDVIPSGSRKVLFCMPEVNGKFIMFCAHYLEGKTYISDVLFRDAHEGVEDDIKRISPEYCVFECDKSYFFMIRELRNLSDIRCSSPGSNKMLKISAHQQNINTSFFFAQGYDNDPDYTEFMNNILDFDSKDNHEAIYALSHASAHIIRSMQNK